MSKETIRRPDNKDNKYRENNEVQSTMVTTAMTVADDFGYVCLDKGKES